MSMLFSTSRYINSLIQYKTMPRNTVQYILAQRNSVACNFRKHLSRIPIKKNSAVKENTTPWNAYTTTTLYSAFIKQCVVNVTTLVVCVVTEALRAAASLLLSKRLHWGLVVPTRRLFARRTTSNTGQRFDSYHGCRIPPQQSIRLLTYLRFHWFINFTVSQKKYGSDRLSRKLTFSILLYSRYIGLRSVCDDSL